MIRALTIILSVLLLLGAVVGLVGWLVVELLPPPSKRGYFD